MDLDRELEAEGRTLALFRVEDDLAALVFDHASSQVQAEAGTIRSGLLGVFGPEELREELLLGRVRHADTGIGNGNPDHVVLVCDRYGHAALLRVVNGIVDEIHDDLTRLTFVDVEAWNGFRRWLELKRQVFAVCGVNQLPDFVLNHLDHVSRRAVDHEPAGGESGHIQQV